MPIHISDAEIRAYANDETVLIKKLLSTNEVEDLRLGVDKIYPILVLAPSLQVMGMIQAGFLKIFVPSRKILYTRELSLKVKFQIWWQN